MRNTQLHIPLSEDEKRKLVEAAEAEGLQTATWARRALLDAARASIPLRGEVR